MKPLTLTLAATMALIFISCYNDNGAGTSFNPAALLKTEAQKTMVGTLKDVADGHLYTLDYGADYQLDKLMERGGAKSGEELLSGVMTGLLNIPTQKTMERLDYGCSAFCVKSPEGDVLVGRNFDYRFVSSANILVHNKACKNHESFCISALPFIDKDIYVAGSLSDGKTDLSVPITASIYCCLDGMNDSGLFIGVLSLRGGGAVQHQPGRANIVPSLAIRLALDNCATVNDAVNMFRGYNFFADGEEAEYNYHFLIADATGKSVVVEYYRPGESAPVEKPNEKDWTINVLDEDHVTNFYLSEGWTNLGGGRDRYEKIHSALETSRRTMTEAACMDLLNEVHTDLKPSEITSNTQWSVVYNLTKKTAVVCVDKDYKRKLRYTLSVR